MIPVSLGTNILSPAVPTMTKFRRGAGSSRVRRRSRATGTLGGRHQPIRVRGVRHEDRPRRQPWPLLSAPTDGVQLPVPGPDVVTPALSAAQGGDMAAHVGELLERRLGLPERQGVAGA